jgi:hypothetical protein
VPADGRRQHVFKETQSNRQHGNKYRAEHGTQYAAEAADNDHE